MTQSHDDKKALLEALAAAGGKLTAEEDVLFQGTKLIIPANMNLLDARKFIKEKIDEDEKPVEFTRLYKYRPWDGARATLAALKKAFGMVSQRETQGMFGPNPPQLIDIEVDVDVSEQVPWGGIAVPLLPQVTFTLGGHRDPELGVLFSLGAEGPRKYRFEIEGIFRLVEHELETNSMYRGKAFDGKQNPSFLDLRGFDRRKVIYPEDVMVQLEANVWSVLRYADAYQEVGLPLKRAVLLEGPFGSGKTLAASWTAQVAVEHGWTFISCRPGKDDLLSVMQTARLYQPAVVFFEDVDTVTDPNAVERDQVTKLLDVFDGITAKDTRIVVVLTTNHVERIHKGMVRPGRLDAVIHIGEMDRDGFERLVKVCVPDDRLGEVDYDEVAGAFRDFMPAFAREAIDRAVRYCMARNQGKLTVLDTADFVEAAEGLRPQLDLMRGAGETKAEPASLDAAFHAALDRRLDRTVVIDSDEDQVFRLRTE